MFKYNELSDLKYSDELVIPQKKEGDKILCYNKDKNEYLYYSFEDFDFDKTPGEREGGLEIEVEPEDKYIIIEDLSTETNMVVTAEYISIKKHNLKQKPKDYFVKSSEEKRKILDAAGYKYNRLSSVNIYVEEV